MKTSIIRHLDCILHDIVPYIFIHVSNISMTLKGNDSKCFLRWGDGAWGGATEGSDASERRARERRGREEREEEEREREERERERKRSEREKR